ncbi:MAG: DUF3575 domain-containing protein [Sphingobacteriales bacterium]|nr:DUF3575 domain-containing protein [Sphingobacteriales bacterium]
MKSTYPLLLVVFIAVSTRVNAQQNSVQPESGNSYSTYPKTENNGPALNLVKVNLSALVLKNFSLQYERVLNKKFAAALAFRVMPASTLPFKRQILDAVGNDPDTREVVDNFRMSNIAITPEFRFYPGKKGYGRGFYLAPFYRYASFKSSRLIFNYTDGLGGQQSITLSGKLNSNTAGLLLGAQWPLGKMLVLDWWILGPHYGAGSGKFTGLSSQPMNPIEQNDLRNELENLDIPFTRKKVFVDANSARMELDGPWAGVRAGFSLGVKF